MAISHSTWCIVKGWAFLVLVALLLIFIVSSVGCRSYEYVDKEGRKVSASIVGTNSNIGSLHAKMNKDGGEITVENLTMEERLTTALGQVVGLLGRYAGLPMPVAPPVQVPEPEEEPEAEPEAVENGE